MKKHRLLTITALIFCAPVFAQVLSSPGGTVTNNGTPNQVVVNGYTILINPVGRTLLLERSDDDSWLTFHRPGIAWYSMGMDVSNNNSFSLNYGGALTTPGQFVMTPDGNIGIGTNIPDAKLAVKGRVHAQEVRVDLNGAVAPDYVFEKDYTLPSLDSVQSYINQNKHLPEVPSAKEMEASGVNLGEMNMLLLKKVEELTLYMIELKNEIKALKSKH